MTKILVYQGIKWILVRDDGKNQLYRHPTDPHRRLSVLDPTYTFQPSDAETYLNQSSPNGTDGAETLLYVENGSGYRMRSILKFDTSSQIDPTAFINSATLSLYYYGQQGSDPHGRTYWAYRITQTGWVETQASWNSYKTGTAWAAAGGDYTATNGASVVMPVSYGWVNWTVTAQVQTAVVSVGGVAHFLIKDGTENSGDYGAIFYSRRYSGSSSRPKLYVDWSVNTPISASDSGAGVDSASIGLSVSDSGVGTESDLEVGPLLTDAGVGVDSPSVDVTLSATDAGADLDAPAVQASVPSSDSGGGTETNLDIQNQLTETDAGLGSESPDVSASVAVSENGADLDAPGVQASISGSDFAVGSEAASSTAAVPVADFGVLSNETVTTPGTLTVVDEGKGAEFAWRIKPSSPMIDSLVLPHVLSLKISDPATMSDKKIQGGTLPRRTMVGKPGRVVEVDGWSNSQTEIDALDALRDGVRRTFYHPSGDSFGILVTGFAPSATADQYNRRAYQLSFEEAN